MPLVPVTVTVKAPLADALQDKVAVPAPVTLAGLRAQVRPVAELLVPPTFRVLLVGFALIEKSVIVKVTVAE